MRAIVRRYEEERLASALYEKPRPGKKRALNTVQSRAWGSVRLIAEEAAPPVSRETIRILLRSHGLKPWRRKKLVDRGTVRGIFRGGKESRQRQSPIRGANSVVEVASHLSGVLKRHVLGQTLDDAAKKLTAAKCTRRSLYRAGHEMIQPAPNSQPVLKAVENLALSNY